MWYDGNTLDEIAEKHLAGYPGSEVARRLRARRIRLEAQEKMKEALEDNGINPEDIFGT